MAYWLYKSEPSAWSWEQQKAAGEKGTEWTGVRNYQARNFMRDQMKVGDPVLFYASNADPSGVTGLARIARDGYPDAFATRKGHKYFDPDARAEAPTWYMVDIEFVANFHGTVSLETLKATKGLEDMVVTQKGSRLSVQPVTPAEYDIVVKLGRSGATIPPAAQDAGAKAAKGTRKK